MGVTYIIRISKPGFSVYDTDPKNFSLREDTNSPKAFIRNSFDIPATADSGYFKTEIITHNLGYKPLAQAYLFDSNKGRMIPIARFGEVDIKLRDSTVDINFAGVGGNAGKTIFYDLFYEGGS